MNFIPRYIQTLRARRQEARERERATHVIVAFPYSGEVWLRLVVGKALCEHYKLPDSKLLELPWLTRNAGISAAHFTHDGTELDGRLDAGRVGGPKHVYEGKHILFLRRDPRDIVLNCYFHATRDRPVFFGTLSEFLRDPRYGIDKILRWYEAWDAAIDLAASFTMISYEDCLRNPGPPVARTLEFLGGFDVTDETIDGAINFIDTDSFRRTVAAGRYESPSTPSTLTMPRASVNEGFDDGPVGGFREYMNDADLAYCRNALVSASCPVLEAEPDEMTRFAKPTEELEPGHSRSPARRAG